MASITSAACGLSNAPGTWTGGVVPVVGDKVTIQRTGTATNNFTTDTAGYSIGATAITLTGAVAAGSYVVGEAVQFGTDPNYYVISGWNSGTKVLTVGALIVAIPAAATTVYNRGHVVELNATHTWGDDTSSVTPASNAICVSGTLKASRSTSSSLTCRGTLALDANGCIDLGSTGDPLPSSTTCNIILNDSAALALNKHGLVAPTVLNPTFRAVGVQRTRNTTLTGSTLAGATSITVAASVGWAIGDRLVIATDTNDPSRAQIVTISGGSAPTWTVGAITNARAAGCRVGNLTSNIKLSPMTVATGGVVAIACATTNTGGEVDIGDLWIQDIGNGWTGNGANVYNGALSLQIATIPDSKVNVRRVAVDSTGTGIAVGLQVSGAHSVNRTVINDSLVYAQNSSGIRTNVATATVNAYIYRAVTGINCATSQAIDFAFSGYVAGAAECVSFDACQSITLNAADLYSNAKIFSAGTGTVTMYGGSTHATTRLADYRAIGCLANLTLWDANLDSASLTTSLIGGAVAPNPASFVRLNRVGAVTTDNRVRAYTLDATDDTSTRNRGTAAVKLNPTAASVVGGYIFTIPAVSGIAQTVKGYLRFDTNYGTATPPIITLSGQGVSQTYTCTATANQWFGFSFTFTPTNTGDITATLTIQSSNIAGFAWLDGVYHYPMIQYTRHYGYYPAITAALTVDPVVQLSEASAGALSGISYSAGTLTISGTRSIREVYDWMQWYEATNLLTPIMTSSDGVTFALAANLTLSGSLTGSGTLALGSHTFSGAGASTVPITYTGGAYVPVNISGIVNGSRVQVYDTTGAAELYNGVPGTSLLLNVTWTTNHSLRIRAAYQSGTTAYLPSTTTATLTSSGATITVAQVVDSVYAGIGLNGSTLTEFSADIPHLYIDLSGGGTTSAQRLYAWTCYEQTTSGGIQSLFGVVVAEDSLNFKIDTTVADVKLFNLAAGPVIIAGGYLHRSDGTTVISATSGSIQMDPSRAYSAIDTQANMASLALVHGLVTASPLVVTPTTRTAGTLAQTISDNAGTITVTRTA